LEVLVYLALKAILGQPVTSELPDHRVQQEFRVRKALLVPKALKAPQDQTEVLVLDLQDQRDRKDHQGTLDHQDLSDRAALSDQQEQPAAVVLRVRQDQLVLQVLWELLVQLAVLDQPVLTATRDHLAVRVFRVHRVQQGLAVHLEA